MSATHDRCVSRLTLEVACSNSAHPHDRAHHASGVTDDGVRYALFWWQPEGVLDHEGERADGQDDGPDEVVVMVEVTDGGGVDVHVRPPT